MPLDAVCVSALKAELSARIEGMKIDKVQQCERDLLLFSLRGKGESVKLLISANPQCARVHLTAETFEQPASPPMFCMLLRKHIQGGRIQKLSQGPFEREIIITLAVFDETGVFCEKQLIAELRGRGANLILIGADGRIIDCLRRVDAQMNPARQLLPGLRYYPLPPIDRPVFYEAEPETRRKALVMADGSIPADKWLLDSFSAISPLICREIVFRATGKTDMPVSAMSESETLDFERAMDAMADCANYPVPTMVMSGESARDFSFTAICQFGGALMEYDSFSSLLDDFYTKREKRRSAENRARELTRSVRTARDRTLRKLELRRNELTAAEGMDTLRKYGEAITANLYRLKKGDTRLVAQDYYDESLPEIIIPLDPLKTPQQNAAKYFKDYSRQKSARSILSELIAKCETELYYLESVLTELSLAESERELLALRSELELTGYLRKKNDGKKQKQLSFSPSRFISDTGLEILVGRSNTQNDELTFKTASRGDLWLHAQKIHGAHVVLRTGGAPPDSLSLSQAAALAAYFSSAKDGGKTAVDYTAVKYVKKPSGALPGMVIYSEQKTVIAQGDQTLVSRLRRQ